ncbi:chromosomal replication initiator protein DnaA [Ectothiorhodospiraceae bacterium BW-2]|nr:chromosomal replication initiator protein DnaA [Ectothiorhodospiraceae bacterium BW-2]
MQIEADEIWQSCLQRLKSLCSGSDFNLYLNPLQVELKQTLFCLYAPNDIIREQVQKVYAAQIHQCLQSHSEELKLQISVGSLKKAPLQEELPLPKPRSAQPAESEATPQVAKSNFKSNLNDNYTFEQFVEGKSNQLARAAALQVASNPGTAYNPLFIYGKTGLGKTHLMHAIGNAIKKDNPNSRVVALFSEKFVHDMVNGYHHGKIEEFKRYYRTLDALLIDDIQFFAGKEGSQEEFFHTFNTLLEGQKQIVLTCDTLPQGVEKIDDRLKSRFSWGLTICIEPPDLETRVAILKRKAERLGSLLPDDVAFFIAENVRSNVRDLEGALSRVNANAQFRGKSIALEYAREALRDQLAIAAKQVTVDNIQRVVAGYYQIRVADILSKNRTRSVARPRQVAMALAKELTRHSLPELGRLFGDRDHTTVMHACKQIHKLRLEDPTIEEDYHNLLSKLTT